MHNRLKLQRSITPTGFKSEGKNNMLISAIMGAGGKNSNNGDASDSRSDIQSQRSNEGINKSADKSEFTRSVSIIDDDNIDGLEVPEEDEKIAREFLQRFLLNDENSQFAMINLIYFFKSVPMRMTKETYKRCKFFNFKLFQESLVAYMNIQDVNAFEYNDMRNRDRIAGVRSQINEQKQTLDSTRDFLHTLENTINQGAMNVGKEIEKQEEYQKEEQQKLMNVPPSNF